MAEKDAAAKCETCEHWLRNRPDHPLGNDVGDCRRFPPNFFHDHKLAHWPQVQAHQHCGEWTAIP